MQRAERRSREAADTMSCFLHLGASQLTPLLLTLLLPPSLPSLPHPPTLLPTEDSPDLDSTLTRLHADPGDPGADPEAWPRWLQEEGLGEPLLRAQRGDLSVQPLSPFPGGESLHYQEGGEGEEGWRRNEALTSMAGGLQAAGREKGGFVFRFGRTQWTDGGGRRSEEEEEEDDDEEEEEEEEVTWRGVRG